MPTYPIRPATEADIDAWTEHLVAHVAENGRDGILFAPYARDETPPFASPERIFEIRAAVLRPLDQPRWRRVFLATDGDAIVAHADLTGASVPSEMHRCRLGLGVRATHRRHGVGRRLLDGCIAWARDVGLSWIDLGVFDGNAPAVALYRRVGFVETGRTVDRFRVGDRVITDITMSLALR